jgi:hypothetical protein
MSREQQTTLFKWILLKYNRDTERTAFAIITVVLYIGIY